MITYWRIPFKNDSKLHRKYGKKKSRLLKEKIYIL